jgi:hypothetical protein
VRRKLGVHNTNCGEEDAMDIAFMSPGVLTDAGGFIIYIGSDGKIHIKRVPPWNPETLRELQAAVTVIDQVGRIENRAVADQFLKVAEGVIGKHVGELQKVVGEG